MPRFTPPCVCLSEVDGVAEEESLGGVKCFTYARASRLVVVEPRIERKKSYGWLAYSYSGQSELRTLLSNLSFFDSLALLLPLMCVFGGEPLEEAARHDVDLEILLF